MKRRKRIWRLLPAFLAVSLLLTGCSLRCVLFNNLDTVKFYANHKADLNAAYGKKAMVWNGRVYYLSAELGTQGVYSMAADGTDVRLEFPAEDIRALAGYGKDIYYAGYAGRARNENGSYRRFRLFRRAAAGGEATDVLEGVAGAETEYGMGVWSLYIAGDGVIVMRTPFMGWIDGRIYLSLDTLKDGELQPTSSYRTVVENDPGFTHPGNNADFSLYRRGNLYAAASTLIRIGGETSFSLGDVECIYDADTGKSALDMERVFVREPVRMDGFYTYWICRIADSHVLLAAENGLIDYDLAAHRVREITRVPEPEWVYAHYDRGKDVLLLTDSPPAKGIVNQVQSLSRKEGGSLYRVDPETGQLDRLLALGVGEAILLADDTRAATASGRTVLLYDIAGDEAVLRRRVRLEHPIVQRENKVDAAGEWLFLYRFNRRTGRDELIEKVFAG